MWWDLQARAQIRDKVTKSQPRVRFEHSLQSMQRRIRWTSLGCTPQRVTPQKSYPHRFAFSMLKGNAERAGQIQQSPEAKKTRKG